MKDPVSGEVVREARTYFPRVDVTVTAGDGLSRSPAATLEVLDKLAATPVTPDNWKLLAEELEYLDIPQKQTIVDEWERKFEPIVPPELIRELENNPVLLEMVGDMVLAAMDADGEEQPVAQAQADSEPAEADALVQGSVQEAMGFGVEPPAGMPMM